MCSNYQAVKEAARLEKRFGAKPPAEAFESNLHPRQTGMFLRRPARGTAPADSPVESVVGRWGLISPRSTTHDLALATSNARSERVATAKTYQGAWHARQFCVIPAEFIVEPDWRMKFHVPTRFTSADGQPWAIAGLWDRGTDESGRVVDSYTMLTINADAHPVFRQYHRPGEEKRMVVFLSGDSWERWLEASVEEARSLLLPVPADQVVATPAPVVDSSNLSLF